MTEAYLHAFAAALDICAGVSPATNTARSGASGEVHEAASPLRISILPTRKPLVRTREEAAQQVWSDCDRAPASGRAAQVLGKVPARNGRVLTKVQP